MKCKLSLLMSAAAGALVLVASFAFAESTAKPETGETVQPTTEAAQAMVKADQASLAPKNEEDKVKGVEVWGNIYQVLSHPRCANCHVADDRPRWSGKSYGKTRLHGMNVQATETRMGMPGQQMCSTCHAETNSDLPHGPPGVKEWKLAPVEMVWWEKSSKELCAIVKDPTKTGGRDIKSFADHIGHDPLVAWGWKPGVGREPAPFSADETVAMLEQWLALGLPCPE